MRKLIYTTICMLAALMANIHAANPIGGLFDAVGTAVEETGQAVGNVVEGTGDVLTGKNPRRHHHRHLIGSNGNVVEERDLHETTVNGRPVHEEETVTTYVRNVR